MTESPLNWRKLPGATSRQLKKAIYQGTHNSPLTVADIINELRSRQMARLTWAMVALTVAILILTTVSLIVLIEAS